MFIRRKEGKKKEEKRRKKNRKKPIIYYSLPFYQKLYRKIKSNKNKIK